MSIRILMTGLALAAIAAAACAQTLPAVPPPTSSTPPADAAPPAYKPPVIPGGQVLVGPLPALDSKIIALLTILHDRPKTLKNFTAKVDYSVEHTAMLSTEGKRGTLAYITDPAAGPIFSVGFTEDTEAGAPTRKHQQAVIFNGRILTTKDWSAKQFTRRDMLPAGAKPGDAVTLNGALPLPIGLDIEDVRRNFEISQQPSKDPGQSVLRMVPRLKSKFDFKQLEITVDSAIQLPVKLVETALGANSDVTTITLTEIAINTDKAKMLDAGTPASEGWTERGK